MAVEGRDTAVGDQSNINTQQRLMEGRGFAPKKGRTLGGIGASAMPGQLNSPQGERFIQINARGNKDESFI